MSREVIWSCYSWGCGVGDREGGGTEVLWGGRVVCGREVRCEVLSDYGVGSGEGEYQQSCSRCAPVVRGEDPPCWSWPGGEDTVDVGPEGSRGGT